MPIPRFEFDPEKDRSNRERHGIGLAAAEELWRVTHAVTAVKRSGGESRHAIIGELTGKLWVAIFTMRGEAVRLISFHRADRRLERIYEKKIKKKNGEDDHD